MKLRSIVWIVVFVLSVSVASTAAQRGGGGRGGGRGGGPPNNNNNNNNQNNNQQRNNNRLPPEGATREDQVRFQNKPRPMLEIVEALQRRTGRPISYEDPLWAYEGAAGKPGDIKRTIPFRDPSKPNAPAGKDILSLTTANYEFKFVVDARTHLMPEPVDGSLGAVLTTVIADYTNKQLPGSYTHLYLGDVNTGGFGWLVVPKEFKERDGKPAVLRRVLDYPISFPLEERSTHATFQLIAELVTKASGQQVLFKKLASEANLTGRATETKPVDLPLKQFVKLGASNETARSVIAKALRGIERGDPRTQGPIPQRAWRLLYSIDTRSYYLDVVEVRQEAYKVDGSSNGTKPVNWPTSPAAAASAAPIAAVAPPAPQPAAVPAPAAPAPAAAAPAPAPAAPK